MGGSLRAHAVADPAVADEVLTGELCGVTSQYSGRGGLVPAARRRGAQRAVTLLLKLMVAEVFWFSRHLLAQDCA